MTNEAKLKAQIKELRRWKREAMMILNDLNFETIAKELNVGLGDSISKAVLPGILRLKREMDTLEIKLAEARRRTIPLDGSHGEVNFLPISVQTIKTDAEVRPVYSEASRFPVAMMQGNLRSAADDRGARGEVMSRQISPKELERLGWSSRRSVYKQSSFAGYVHPDGWRIQHCGHATALHPYMLFDRNGDMILSGARGPCSNPHFGTAWDTVLDAVDYVRIIGKTYRELIEALR